MISNDTGEDRNGRLVNRPPEGLRPHPACLQAFEASAAEVRAARSRQGEVAPPLSITASGLLLDGYRQWKRALARGYPTVPCIEYDLDDDNALLFILGTEPRDQLNDFNRISMALELAPRLREPARLRQQQAGKLSSKLTEGTATDVRDEIARIARVGSGNVTKVRQLQDTATPEVLAALRRGTVRIHRAWGWRKLLPKEQNAALVEFECRKDIRHTIRRLIRNHTGTTTAERLSASQLRLLFAASDTTGISATVVLVDLPGNVIAVTRKLYDSLKKGKAN